MEPVCGRKRDMLVELHLHLDGSLRPQTVWELVREQGIRIPAKTVEEVCERLEAPADCRTLEEYLERFELPLMVLQREEALERVTYELVEDLAKEGVTYAEIRFAPQLSLEQGMTQDEAVRAAIRGARRGMKEYPQLQAGLILCCMRGTDKEALNLQTVETARQHLGNVVCAVDLAGAESLFPTEWFAPVFERARQYRIPMTIHAGEAAGPDSMRAALACGAKRIGHGVAAAEDPELIRRLIDEQVTLEVCVTSNYQTKAVPSIAAHPIRRLFDAGVRVTVNSDNRTCSGTNVCREIGILKTLFGFTDEEIRKLQQYAWEARFVR